MVDTTSSSRLSIPHRWFVPALPWAVLTFVCVAAAGWPNTRPLYVDSVSYRALALGQYDQVAGSVAGRMLHPAFVRFVSYVSGLNVDDAFLAVAVGTLAVLVVNMAWILKQITGAGALVLPLLFTPVLTHEMFRLYYCQDLFYAALLSCLFVALVKGRLWFALALLFPLYLSRESTVLLALVWAGIAWFESERRIAVVCGVLTVAGLGVSRMFASLGQPNVHHTNELVFLALKPPFDALRTLLGIVLVPTEMRGRPGYACGEIATVGLPAFLRYGFTTQFGICRPDLRIPLHTYSLCLSVFGIGPAVLWTIWRCNGGQVLAESVPQWLKITLLYGVLAFLVAPVVSFWLERDFGYAWPAFWIATPFLFHAFFRTSPRIVVALLLENLGASWVPYWLAVDSAGWTLVAALGIAVISQGVTLWTLGKIRESPSTELAAHWPQPLVTPGLLRSTRRRLLPSSCRKLRTSETSIPS